MQNKQTTNCQIHNRPFFSAFVENNTGLYWMIPFSSQIEKYQTIYDKKIKDYGRCDTIAFGDVLGHRKAFLIQNMCPANKLYLSHEYIDKGNSIPVRLNGKFERKLIQQATRVLALHRNGTRLIFPDVLGIEQSLLHQSQIVSNKKCIYLDN